MLSWPFFSSASPWTTLTTNVKANLNSLYHTEPATAQKLAGVALFAFAAIAYIRTTPVEELKKAFWDAYSAAILAEQLEGAPQELIVTGRILSALFGSIDALDTPATLHTSTHNTPSDHDD